VLMTLPFSTQIARVLVCAVPTTRTRRRSAALVRIARWASATVGGRKMRVAGHDRQG
jgi:hypothetical protein